MNRSSPPKQNCDLRAGTRFREWRPKPLLAESIHERIRNARAAPAELRHAAQELPDTNIFVGYSLRAEQLIHARELKWIHSTAAGVAQLMYPELAIRNHRHERPQRHFFPCRWRNTPWD